MDISLADPMLVQLKRPSLPPFVAGEGRTGSPNVWETGLALPHLARLRGGETGTTDTGGMLPAEAFEPDEVRVDIQSREQYPTGIQFMACNYLEAVDDELATAIISALVADYPRLRGLYDHYDEDMRRAVMPDIAGADDLKALIRLDALIVHPTVPGATPYLGVAFSARWDEEHGLGMITHGLEVLEIGDGDVAMSSGVAEAHAAAVLARLAAGGEP